MDEEQIILNVFNSRGVLNGEQSNLIMCNEFGHFVGNVSCQTQTNPSNVPFHKESKNGELIIQSSGGFS